MEYLKPIEILKANNKRNFVLAIILALSLLLMTLILPGQLIKGNPLVLALEERTILARAEPWFTSTERIERFSKYYLENRFEWDAQSFELKKKRIRALVTSGVYKQLEESFNAFDALIKNQNARSYVTLEGIGYSEKSKRIEVRFTRLLRIQNLALATPLRAELSFQNVPVSESNPFGVEVASLQESELTKE